MLDEIRPYEINVLLAHSDRRERGEWERARLIAYTVAQSQSTKKLTPKELFPLPWDDEKPQADTQMTNEELTRLEQKAQKYLHGS